MCRIQNFYPASLKYKLYSDACSHKAILQFIKTDSSVTVKWEFNKEEREKANVPHRYNPVVIVLKVVSRISCLVGKN